MADVYTYALPESLQDGRWIGATRARLVRLAQPTMDRMAKECGESVFLGVMTESLDIQYVAKAIGLPQEKIDGTARDADPKLYQGRELLVLRMSEQMVRKVKADAALFAQAAAELGNELIMELLVIEIP